MSTSTASAAEPTEPTEPAWLDDDQQRAWRAYLRGSRLLETSLDRDLLRHGVQLSEYEIISMLSEQPDRRLRMSALADMVVQSRSRLTHTASRLEKRGWVQREACVGDRRGVELVLTPEGLEAITAMARVHVASVREHLLDHLTSAQFAALGQAMEAIAAGIEAGGDCEEARQAQLA
jgi:DNA-binding MarR family transcriptional regulator